MKAKEALKRIQVRGEKYDLPAEEGRVQKLIQKGISLNNRLKEMDSELESVKSELTDIARARRGESVTDFTLSSSLSISFKRLFRLIPF